MAAHSLIIDESALRAEEKICSTREISLGIFGVSSLNIGELWASLDLRRLKAYW